MAPLSMSMAIFIGLMCEAVLYGVYTVLAAAAFYLLLRKPLDLRWTLPNVLMSALTILMYCMSTVHITLSIRAAVRAFFLQHQGESEKDPTVWVQLLLEFLNCLLVDVIVCWRTWELWRRDSRILVWPMACISGGLVCAVGTTYSVATMPLGTKITESTTVKIWFGSFGAFTVSSNIYSVSMIAWKAWTRARALKRFNMHLSGGTYFRVLILIIESGILYSMALTVTFALFLADNNGVYIMADVVIHLTGIYPTIVVVLVCFQVTIYDNVRRAQSIPSAAFGNTARPEPLRPFQKILAWRITRRTDELGLMSSDVGSPERTQSGSGSEMHMYALGQVKVAANTEQDV